LGKTEMYVANISTYIYTSMVDLCVSMHAVEKAS